MCQDNIYYPANSLLLSIGDTHGTYTIMFCGDHEQSEIICWINSVEFTNFNMQLDKFLLLRNPVVRF